VQNIVRIILLALSLSLVACGGGGGSSPPPAPETFPTKAVIKISTQGTPSSSALSGVVVTLNLPPGVTITTNSDGSVASGAVIASGVVAQNNTTVLSTYTPASGSTAATLKIFVASTLASGFGVGEFVTVNANIASGYTPQQSDFTLTNFEPADLSINSVTGLTASLSATFE
jgi:hypothetical protein